MGWRQAAAWHPDPHDRISSIDYRRSCVQPQEIMASLHDLPEFHRFIRTRTLSSTEGKNHPDQTANLASGVFHRSSGSPFRTPED